MGVRSYTDLDAWRLANELKLGVYALIETDAVRRDEDFYRQIRNSASSAPRNIAEFSQYLRVANGSLLETANHLQDGRDRGYFDGRAVEPLVALVRRASAATTRLLRYLRTARAPVPPRVTR